MSYSNAEDALVRTVQLSTQNLFNNMLSAIEGRSKNKKDIQDKLQEAKDEESRALQSIPPLDRIALLKTVTGITDIIPRNEMLAAIQSHEVEGHLSMVTHESNKKRLTVTKFEDDFQIIEKALSVIPIKSVALSAQLITRNFMEIMDGDASKLSVWFSSMAQSDEKTVFKKTIVKKELDGMYHVYVINISVKYSQEQWRALFFKGGSKEIEFDYDVIDLLPLIVPI